MKNALIALLASSAGVVLGSDEICGAPRRQARAEILWTKPLCKEPGRYIGWPTVCRAKNGDLIAVFSGDRDEHICPWGKVQMIRSSDGGQTWSAPENICNTIIDDRDAGIVTLDDGTLVMSWFTSVAYRNSIRDPAIIDPDSPQYQWWLHDRELNPDDVEAQLGAFTRRSTDGGGTWEPPVRTPCSAPHGPIQLKDGRLLYVGKSGDSDHMDLGPGVGKIVAAESTDGGNSWRVIGEIPFPSQIDVLHECHEPHAVETEDGRIVALARCHHVEGGFSGSVQSESADGGRTWTTAKPMGLDGFPPHLLRLSDGKLLAVYGRRWGDLGEFACLSDDQGRTWDVANEIKLAGHWNEDLGYPASVQLPDGNILTVYYQAEKQGEKTCLMGTLWRITDSNQQTGGTNMGKTLLTTTAVAAYAAGLFATEPFLAENLAVWLCADRGVTTNSAGGVTAWANQGTKGASVDVAPHADNSAGHVAYEASGIGGQPSLLFDGSVYLKTASAVDLGVTANGGAWFVVFKTPCTRAERINMGIMGCVPANNQRFGAFFLNDGTERYRSFFFADIGDRPAASNAVQIASAMCWKDGGTTRAYPMSQWEAGTVVQPSVSPGSAVFMVGNMIPSWMPTFKGEIAEIRIYDKALTDRERSRIQFELCARYGVHWAAHGDIDNNALAWCANGAQFGRVTGYGVTEDLVSSVSSGGATFTLGTPTAVDGARGYFSNSGGNGLSRTWYVATHTGTRNASDATFTFDRSEVRLGRNPALYYRQSMAYLWTKLDVEASETAESVSFTLPAGTWVNGFYTAMGDLDSSLAMWHRADMGLETNAVGGVTSWANFGTSGTVLDMAPQSDNSAAHIAYTADGIGGQPSVSFDGNAYLQAAGSTAMSITANGGAWFVVCKTDQGDTERGNRAIFGGESSNRRLGLHFIAGSRNVRGFFFNDTAGGDVAVEAGKTQVFSLMQWTANNASTRYMMRDSTTGASVPTASTPTALNIRIGGNMLSWTPNFVGDIAEIRVYNRPLTGRERSEIQFELCARYGVSWAAHGDIDNNALAWCANGA